MWDEVKFYADRAIVEIDEARRAVDLTGAERHLRVSELHLERVRALSHPSFP